MIDRLELLCSLNLTELAEEKLAGRIRNEQFPELGHLDKISTSSKLFREDEDVREIRTSDLNALYKNTLVERIVADAKEQETHDDPIQFILFARPRFKKDQRAAFKVVCNPNTTPLFRLKEFLEKTFKRYRSWNDKRYFDSFRLGRVDFCVDVETHTVEEIYKSLFVSRKLRKHISVMNLKKELEEDREGYVRLISSTVMETFYVGKSSTVFRCYNKVLEALHQIQVCKAQDWKVSQTLLDRAAKKLLTRLEMQIRDLGRLGQYEEVNKGTGEIKTYHEKRRARPLKPGQEPTPGYYQLETLYDLLTAPQEKVDVFRELRFVDVQRYTMDKPNWKERAFKALVQDVGFDEALRILPANTRRQIKQELVQFEIDLNKKLFEEIRQWKTQ